MAKSNLNPIPNIWFVGKKRQPWVSQSLLPENIYEAFLMIGDEEIESHSVPGTKHFNYLKEKYDFVIGPFVTEGRAKWFVQNFGERDNGSVATVAIAERGAAHEGKYDNRARS